MTPKAGARAQLELAARAPLARRRDRWAYGAGVAAIGPVFGLYSAFGSNTAVTVGFFVIMGVVVWGLSLLSTVPRHARAVGNTAMVVGMVLFMIGLTVLNADDEPGWLRAVVTAAVPVPLLVGGALIARGPR